MPSLALPEVRRPDADHRVRAGPGCDRAHPQPHRRADRAATLLPARSPPQRELDFARAVPADLWFEVDQTADLPEESWE